MSKFPTLGKGRQTTAWQALLGKHKACPYEITQFSGHRPGQ